MKLAILSDSHRKLELTSNALKHLKSQGAQYILHAGDLEMEENLQSIESVKLPYVSVFGNNDHNLLSVAHKYKIYKEPHYFKIDDISFKLMHLPFYLTGDTDVVISGHTHMFEHSFVNGTLFLNPGEVCARNKSKSECVLLEIVKDKYIINYFYKKPEDENWEIEIIEYEK